MYKMERGFRNKLENYLDPTKDFFVEISIKGPSEYDSCCFGVDSSGKLSDDRYMVFFNQLSSPASEITLSQSGDTFFYKISLSKLPSSVNKLVFTVNIDGVGTMSAINSCSLLIKQGNSVALEFNLSAADFKDEKAVIITELYKKDQWRIAAVASGFNGGLSDLLKAYGGQEEDDIAEPAEVVQTAKAEAVSPPSPPASTELKVSLEKRLELEAPQLVSLAKPLKVVLEKANLNDCVARVGLVMDISGSMRTRYKDGTVAEIVNKTLPLAVQFDDDGELDLWYYGTTARRMPSVNMSNYQSSVPEDFTGFMRELGGSNNEPLVMREVIKEYKDSNIPAYVLFITDGGVGSRREIKKLIVESAKYPIFWQFVGVGGSSYGVLEKLDTMEGRYVDNANFFALDDFKTVSNSELYSRLLAEFPEWLKEIRRKNMIR